MRRFVTIAAALLVLGMPAVAHAAFPGRNGKIGYLSSDGHLFTVDPNGSGTTEIPTPSGGCEGRQGVSWTADGTHLAIGACGRIGVVAADGSDYHEIASGGAVGSWSPDAAAIAFRGGCPITDYCTIYTVPAGGGQPTALANTDQLSTAEWSPDGSLIAFSKGQGMYTMTPTGQLVTLIPNTAPGDWPESWSPDGSRIALTRHDRPSHHDVYTIGKDGSGIQQLTSDGHSASPAYSPDGTKIVFSSFRDGPQELYVMNADGSSQTRLTSGTGAYYSDWQPIPYTGYPRPKGATPLRLSLVPAYKQCITPNRTHGAPLVFPSCSPPVQASSFLTVGTPDANGAGANLVGSILLRVKTTSPEDLLISGTISDVRCAPGTSAGVCSGANAADGPDYAGELQGNATIRITDHFNGPGLNEAATVQDIPFPLNFVCSNTSDTSTGGVCNVNSGGPVVCPECGIHEGQRTVVEITQMQVFDGGPDGEITTGGNTLFLDQGLFIP